MVSGRSRPSVNYLVVRRVAEPVSANECRAGRFTGEVAVMISFKVVKERHGWAIRTGEEMMTPYWSRELAIREADRMSAGLSRHGALTEVLIEEIDSMETIVVGSSLIAGAETCVYHDDAVRQ
jgi:hypothetical protein